MLPSPLLSSILIRCSSFLFIQQQCLVFRWPRRQILPQIAPEAAPSASPSSPEFGVPSLSCGLGFRVTPRLRALPCLFFGLGGPGLARWSWASAGASGRCCTRPRRGIADRSPPCRVVCYAGLASGSPGGPFRCSWAPWAPAMRQRRPLAALHLAHRPRQNKLTGRARRKRRKLGIVPGHLVRIWPFSSGRSCVCRCSAAAGGRSSSSTRRPPSRSPPRTESDNGTRKTRMEGTGDGTGALASSLAFTIRPL